jgi:hypothetical protein
MGHDAFKTIFPNFCSGRESGDYLILMTGNMYGDEGPIFLGAMAAEHGGKSCQHFMRCSEAAGT